MGSTDEKDAVAYPYEEFDFGSIWNQREGDETLSDLAALPADGGDRGVIPLVVTTGDPEENRELVERHGIRCAVLLQEQTEIASRFRASLPRSSCCR